MTNKKSWASRAWSATQKGAKTTTHYTLQTTTLGQYGNFKDAQEVYQKTYDENVKTTSAANSQINLNSQLSANGAIRRIHSGNC